jgi:hypothetical protein
MSVTAPDDAFLDVRVPGAVYSDSITLPVGTAEAAGYTDNYTTEIMRDPRYYGDGVPDWKVPDGDYLFNTFLACSSVTSAGVVTAIMVVEQQ